MSFWAELQRRNVFKVGAAYVIVAWLLVQVVAVVFPALQLPVWTVTFVTALLLIGFPVAVFLAWAYEVTPEGIKRTRHVPLTESIRHVTGQRLNYAVTGLLVAAVAFLVADRYWLGRDAGGGTAPVDESAPAADSAAGAGAPDEPAVLRDSVAVLPFANLSPDSNNAYFADGLHESILNQLAKIEDLTVIARTSMLRYATGDKTVPEIAEELNVETVMEGSARYAGNTVRVTAQLIDAETGAHLWSEEYDRDLSDIFEIQSDIARRIAQALQVEFSLVEQARVDRPPTSSPEAYALYLRAIAAAGGRFPLSAGLQVAGLIDRAIELDPDFALAYTLRAEMLDAVDEAGALAAIERALELDPNLGIAHAALADIHRINWRGREARQSFETAVGASPNDADVLRRYAMFNAMTGRRQDALDLAERAAELDPQNAGSHLTLAWVHQLTGDREGALVAVRDSLTLAPANAGAHLLLARVELSRGNLAAARESLRFGTDLIPDLARMNEVSRMELAYNYRLAGLAEEARTLAGTPVLEGPEAPLSILYYELALGDYDGALATLRAALDTRPPVLLSPPSLLHIVPNIWHDPVLDEPRFREAREALRLPE